MISDGRLRWHCRRGMLELDLLLGAFLARGFDALDEEGRLAFERLLAYPDQVLLEMLMGRMAPAEPGIAYVVAQIKGAALPAA